MRNDRLYKYLDADGGLMMLYYGTLMFTNATQLNDPFDCHPAYIHFSGEMPSPYKGWSPETVVSNHFATKAKEWQHEQEVRLIAYDPSPMHMRLLPGQYEEESVHKQNMSMGQRKKDDTCMDEKEFRAFLDIGGECFESVYLGVLLKEKKNAESREKIIKAARKCNPNIKIYQMTIDPEAFRLKEEQI